MAVGDLDSVSFTSVSILLLQWYIGYLCPLWQKPRDVIKCCMFTLCQQDTNQRRTQKAKLINTVSLWPHAADNQSPALLWNQRKCSDQSGEKHTHTWLRAEMQFTTGNVFPGWFHIYNKHGCRHASLCNTGTHVGTQNSEAKHPWLQAVSVLLLLVNKQKIMLFLPGCTCTQPGLTLDALIVSESALISIYYTSKNSRIHKNHTSATQASPSSFIFADIQCERC